jgi:O-antigen/teichoic acid export membrane protein
MAPVRGAAEKRMSGLDIFAWIVLVVFVASTVFVIVFMAMWPGMVARRRNHPWAEAVAIGGWVTLFLGFVLWPVVLIWAYVDVPANPVRGAGNTESAR